MSKIKLTGDASGTGTLTIAAPNTDSDYSVTLPEITGGEFVVSDSSGNVGIGTDSPSSTLHIKADADSINDGLRLESANGTQYATIDMNNAGNLRFYQNGTSRMRIDASGNLLVGITSLPAYSVSTGTHFAYKRDTGALYAMQSTSGWANFYIGNNTGGGNAGMSFRYAGGNVGSIYINTSSTSYNTSSDYRLKEDWQPMSGSIDRVKALNPVNFAWKVDGSRVDGFLAHEAADVVPEAVTGTKDAVDAEGNPEYQGIDQSKLVPLLTSALQEAIAKIEDLETRLAAVEGA